MALPFTNYIFCHFHATYMDSMTGDPALKKIQINKWDLTMNGYARFDESLTMGHFLNELLILYMKFANLVPLGRHLYERDDW